MDDDPQIREVYSRALTKLGYEPVITECGEEAVELFEESEEGGDRYDAVIMDLTVPGGMGGREAVRSLLRINPTVKVVVASGYSSDPVLSNPSAYGFSAVLPKPFTPRDLADVLHHLVNDADPA